eukprot:TRINITY_DN12332_c0_g1_i1.p1 TRINITY_DN12332_c0_g1~~TRINITY_DN12332_c0_g1_i1.p1  ORF type:complete len:164 (-),score=33.13 TRINITY_DN12332_c0_g1_i1:35-526(-)
MKSLERYMRHKVWICLLILSSVMLSMGGWVKGDEMSKEKMIPCGEVTQVECIQYCEFADECVPDGFEKPLEHWQRCTSVQEEVWIAESNRLLDICWDVLHSVVVEKEEEGDGFDQVVMMFLMGIDDYEGIVRAWLFGGIVCLVVMYWRLERRVRRLERMSVQS